MAEEVRASHLTTLTTTLASATAKTTSVSASAQVSAIEDMFPALASHLSLQRFKQHNRLLRASDY